MDAEDCKPNKPLRTTVKVWLKKRGAEREAASKRDMASRAPATTATPATPGIVETSTQRNNEAPAPTLDDGAEPGSRERPSSREVSEAQSASEVAKKTEGRRIVSEAQKDIPQPSIEVSNLLLNNGNATNFPKFGGDQLQDSGEDAVDREGVQQQDSTEQGNQQQSENNDEQQKQQKQLYDQWMAMNGSIPGMSTGALGFDGSNGGFPGMGFNTAADFSQMMQFMPTGMQNNLMGTFPNMMCKSYL